MSQDEVFEGGNRNGRVVQHFLVDVTSAGYDHLLRVLLVAFSDVVGFGYNERRAFATHMLIDGSRRITFFRVHGGELRRWLLSPSRFDDHLDRITAFPEPIGAEPAAKIVWDWLAQAEYGHDEGDGATYKGWRVFNHRFGHVHDYSAAFVAIRPMWIYLTK